MSAFAEHLADLAGAREQAGLRRQTRSHVDRGLIDLAGNDYLSLRRDPRVIAGAVAATEDWGTGAGASRLVTGTAPVHEELEDALAEHFGTQSALVFSSGYLVNVGVLTALGDADTLIVSDAHNHASLVDGSRLARAAVTITPHGDLAAVEQALAGRTQTRALIVVESVFSVLGDAAPLAELHALAERYDAWLVVDEAHGLGVVGERGQGLAATLGLTASDRAVVVTSLSKSLASQGGAFAGTALVREHLVNAARSFIFDTGLAPAAAGAALAALDVLAEEPQRCARTRLVAAALAEACGVDTPAGAVLSVPMPGPREALSAVDRCHAHRVRIGCFRPPSTPDGISRLRLTAHAGVNDADLAHATDVLRRVTSNE